jgi:hypothetical protein
LWHVWGRGEVHVVFWWVNQKERDHLEDTDVDGRLILKCIVKTWDGGMDRIIWLRIGIDGMLLSMRLYVHGLHNIRRIPSLAEDMLASQEGLCSMELPTISILRLSAHSLYLCSISVKRLISEVSKQ